MNTKSAELFQDKEVWLFPGDTYKKRGIVVSIDDFGITFKITYYNGSDKQYQVGLLYYITYSSKIVMSEYMGGI